MRTGASFTKIVWGFWQWLKSLGGSFIQASFATLGLASDGSADGQKGEGGGLILWILCKWEAIKSQLIQKGPDQTLADSKEGKATTNMTQIIVLASVVIGAVGVYKWFTYRTFDVRNINFIRASELTKSHLKELWTYYDLQGQQYLEPAEVRALIIAYFRKMSGDRKLCALYANQLFSSVNAHARANLRIRDKVTVALQKLFSKLHTDSQCVYEEISDRLDGGIHQGVTKNEFVSLFTMWIENKVSHMLRDTTMQ